LSILRVPEPIQQDTKYAKLEPTLALSIKVESPETQGEVEPSTQVVPPASLGYQPCMELEAYVNAHLRSMAASAPSSALGSGTEATLTLPIKMENPGIMAEGELRLVSQVVPPASLGYQPSAELEASINTHLWGAAAPSSASATPRSRVTVKREYEEDSSASLVGSKRIKIEEI